MERIYTGKIKWFDPTKGFGFIVCRDFEEDIFFQSIQCMFEGLINPKNNQPVEFQVFKDKKGYKAMNIYEQKEEDR